MGQTRISPSYQNTVGDLKGLEGDRAEGVLSLSFVQSMESSKKIDKKFTKYAGKREARPPPGPLLAG